MKTISGLVLLFSGLLFQAGAMAAPVIWTAHISADGTVHQTGDHWVKGVELTNKPNYPATYKVNFNQRIVHDAPRFCSVSPTDFRDETFMYHGQARMVGKPKVKHMTVITQMVGLSSKDIAEGRNRDSAQEFLLMCVR